MKKVLTLLLIGALLNGCSSSDNDPNDPSDDFDRAAMLANWADNIIVPALQQYVEELGSLRAAVTDFNGAPTVNSLQTLRTEWLDAYMVWQQVSMFEIGRAETITLRNFTNIYPADAQQIDENIAQGEYNLTLPSTNDEQGFPALDYLINGIAGDDAAIVQALDNDNHKTYLNDLITRMVDMATEVRNDWTSGYRDTFVNNSGSMATSAVNKLVNDFIFYYEKALRAGKIGIPAGVFSTAPLSDRVEALYHGDASKALFLEALNASQNFFNGKHFGSATTGESLSSYLTYLNTIKDGEDLAGLINNQFDASRTSAANLMDNLSQQVITNNARMLETYDQLQMNVVLMKVDMFQALNIQVDFVDADGD